MALELANLYNAAGRGADSISSYDKLLKNAEAGNFPDAHIEMAWYGLGEAQRGQHNFKAAEDAYERVLTFSKADPDLRLRATLGAGEMCDVLARRNDALKHYRAVLAQVHDSPQADEARKHLKEPYRI
jgi:tetratricopeptide (TPR) repeat protein